MSDTLTKLNTLTNHPRFLIALAAAGSAGLLGGAFLFQLLGYPPCAMCLWQRWPHAAAVLIGVLALTLPAPLTGALSASSRAGLALLGSLAAAITGGLGLYHTGVERDWWEGPASCTSSGGGLGGDLLATDVTVVLCDQVSWQLLGLSMASWNALASLVLAAIWLAAARRLT